MTLTCEQKEVVETSFPTWKEGVIAVIRLLLNVAGMRLELMYQAYETCVVATSNVSRYIYVHLQGFEP